MSYKWLDCENLTQIAEICKSASKLHVCRKSLGVLLYQYNEVCPKLRKIKYKNWTCCRNLEYPEKLKARVKNTHRFPMLSHVNVIFYCKLDLFFDFQTLFAINKQRIDACVCLHLCMRGFIDKNVIKIICGYLKDWPEIEDPRIQTLRNLKQKSKKLKCEKRDIDAEIFQIKKSF